VTPADELAIRNLYAAYCFAADERKQAAMGNCFTEDAVIQVTGTARQSELAGRTAIAAVQETPSSNRHLTLNLLLAPDGAERVRGLAYFLLLDRSLSPVSFGRYEDEVVRDADGEWRFRRRRIVYEHQAPAYAKWVERVMEAGSQR
jgi:hypothetical protein